MSAPAARMPTVTAVVALAFPNLAPSALSLQASYAHRPTSLDCRSTSDVTV